MGLSIEQFAVKREVTTTLSFVGNAADLIIAARAANAEVMLTLYRIDYTDWTTPKYRTWKADMSTYSRDGGVVSVGFASSTARDEIEKNRGTKYEIPLPSTHILDYAGIDRDATNMVSGIVKTIDSSDALHYDPDNWILPGNQSQTETADLTVNNFKFKSTASASQTFNIRLKVGALKVGFKIPLFQTSGYNKLILARYHEDTLIDVIRQWPMNLHSSKGTMHYFITGIANAWTIWDNGTDTLPVTMEAGDDLRLFFNTSKSPDSINVSNTENLRLEVVTNESSDYRETTVKDGMRGRERSGSKDENRVIGFLCSRGRSVFVP